MIILIKFPWPSCSNCPFTWVPKSEVSIVRWGGSSIGNNKIFDASFSVEIDPDDTSKGFFISGVLGAEKVEDFILLEGESDDKFYLQQETEELFVTNLIPNY